MRFVIERLIGYRIIQRFDFLKLWLFTLTTLSETEGRNNTYYCLEQDMYNLFQSV